MKTIDPPSTRFIFALALLFTCAICAHAQSPKWILTWSDEFSGPANSAPDPKKWAFDPSDTNNHELESYTSSPANIHQQDGHLVIAALKAKAVRADGTTRDYTSARIFTKGRFSQTYGRFEASIKMPLGKGIWPAFWLLGDDIDTVGWPKSGEIDIVENIGESAVSHSTIHGPGYSGAKGPTTAFTLPRGQHVDTAFHLYALEWSPNDLKFFLDDRLVEERTPADLPAGAPWAFNRPFFIILNLAVGGDWPGNPDASTTFPQQMLVDYVRVYKAAQTRPRPCRSRAPEPAYSMISFDPQALTLVPEAAALSRPTLSRFLNRARTLIDLSGEVDVLLTSDAEIKRLNRTFRNKNKATDVLSFPSPPEIARQHAGDLAVSLETAAGQAAQFQHALADELRILILHGLLHIAGLDHETDAGEMALRESDLRAALKLPANLIARMSPTSAANQPTRKKAEPPRLRSSRVTKELARKAADEVPSMENAEGRIHRSRKNKRAAP